MALTNKSDGKEATINDVAKATNQFGGKRGQRKSYGHEMTGNERYALREVQSARSALQKIAIAIQSGKEINADVIQACSQLKHAIAGMLF